MPRVPSVNELSRSLKTQGIFQFFNKEIESRFNKFSQRAINTFFRKFDKHKVSRELKAGAKSPNLSGTLPVGNLFTFLGFEEGGLNPVDQLRDFLEDEVSVEYKGFENGRVLYIAYFPEWESIYKETPLEWATGRSWVRGVEHGVSGLGRFLYSENKKRGRSGGGVQIKGNIRGGGFRPTSYLSGLRRDFLREVEGFKNDLTGKRRR